MATAGMVATTGGVSTEYTIDDGSTASFEIPAGEEGYSIVLTYTEGAWSNEHSFTLTDSSGVLLAEGSGGSSGSGAIADLSSGESVTAFQGVWGRMWQDIDDMDPSVGACEGDLDCDEIPDAEDCDADGDGYGTCTRVEGTLRLELDDTYGDGWDGAKITVTTGGTSTAYTIDDGGHVVYYIEPFEAGYSIVMTYTEGDWSSEHSFNLNDSSGNVITQGQGGPSGSGAIKGLSWGETVTILDGSWGPPMAADSNDLNSSVW